MEKNSQIFDEKNCKKTFFCRYDGVYLPYRHVAIHNFMGKEIFGGGETNNNFLGGGTQLLTLLRYARRKMIAAKIDMRAWFL